MFYSPGHYSPYSLITSIICGAISAYLAKTKGKNPILWFFLGALFGIFGILYLSFSGQQKKATKREKSDPNTIDITPKYDPTYNKVFWYALKEDRHQEGPMSFDALLRAKREGRISDSTLIWSEQLDKWQAFDTLVKG